MRKTTFLTRVLALVLSVMLVLTGMPMAVFAEEEQSSETQETLDASEITESSTDEAANGTGEDTVEDQPVTEETEDAAELEPDDVLSENTSDDAETDPPVEDGNPDETVTDAEIVLDEEDFPVIDEAEDEIVWEDEEQDDYMIVLRSTPLDLPALKRSVWVRKATIFMASLSRRTAAVLRPLPVTGLLLTV